MKTCSRCRIDKEDSDFRMRYEKRGKGSKKLSYLNNTCRQCESKTQNKTYFSKKDDPKFLEDWRKKSRDYYQKNKEIIREKARIKRQKPEYKEMVRKYREKNKDKIHKQEVITKRRYHEKHRDGLTDDYIIRQLISQDVATRSTLKMHPEIIEAKRLQLLITRKTKNHAN